MTTREIFDEIRMLGGHIEARGDRLHVEVPAGVLTPDLRAALVANKDDILAKLSAPAIDPTTELQASMRQLEAACVSIAIFDDGDMQVIRSDEAREAEAVGGTVFSPVDMYYYVRLQPDERRMFHSLKTIRPSDWKGREMKCVRCGEIKNCRPLTSYAVTLCKTCVELVIAEWFTRFRHSVELWGS